MCRAVYADSPPPCSTCEPVIHPYNLDVLRLYESCKDQVIVGPTGPIALNDINIKDSMKYYFEVEPESRLKLSSRVRMLFNNILRNKFEREK